MDIQNLNLPIPSPPGGVYAPVRRFGSLLFVSGQGPKLDGKRMYEGKVGAEVTMEEAYQAAELCAKNALSQALKYLKENELSSIRGVVKTLVFVASNNDFYDQPFVANGASNFFKNVFGENGLGSRSAVGVNVLPGNIPVEVEVVFELE